MKLVWKIATRYLTLILPVMIPPLAQAWEPLRPHPENPRILEFRGEPVVLRTFAEHYSSIINEDFDYIKYLDSLKEQEINLTRVFLAGFRVAESAPTVDPLAPRPERFLQPWPRAESETPALDGLGKWDLSQWNDAYFERLRRFLDACSERDIVVELTFFCTFYTELMWRASPFHPENNVQGIGPLDRYETMRAVDPALFEVQREFVRKVVTELNGYDNIYYEIQNEPFWNQPGIKDGQEAGFHNQLLELIRAVEDPLPNRHLIAHNFPQQFAGLSTGFDIFNAHYPKPVPNTPVYGAENLLANQYGSGKILAIGETDTLNAKMLRLEAWMFLNGGGAIYNGLDYANMIYTVGGEAGDSVLGRAKRRVIRDAGRYMESLHLTGLRRDLSWISSGMPEGAKLQAMSAPGQQYSAYLHHGGDGGAWKLSYDPIDSSPKQAALTVELPAGEWRVLWTKPDDLSTLHVQQFHHVGGPRELEPVAYQEDVALRIDRAGEGDLTPPPLPRRLRARTNPDGSLSLEWGPVNARDFSTYRIYRSQTPNPETGESTRIASTAEARFHDQAVEVGNTYHYVVTAVDQNGNESATGRSVAVVPRLSSTPLGGVARAVPGRIEAEDFDEGGQGIAYHDLNAAASGGPYRGNERVEVEETTDEGGAFHVASTLTGEWLNYSVNVAASGAYTMRLRVANDAAGGAVRLLVDGMASGGQIEIPDTGDVGEWKTVEVPGITLEAGHRVLRLEMVAQAQDGIAGHINWMEFEKENKTGPGADAGPDREVPDEDSDGTALVIMDGSASSQGDAPILIYEWIVAGEVVATGMTASVSLGTGATEVILRVTDGNGLTDSDTVRVIVNTAGLRNGSFEQGLDGWTATGNLVNRNAAPYQPTEGLSLVAFNNANSTPNGVISQSFATVPGMRYRLTFDMGVLSYNTQLQQLQVEVSSLGTLIDKTYSLSGLGSGSNRWQTIELSFIPNNHTSTLVFRDKSTVTSNLDLTLDNVRILPQITRALTVVSMPFDGVRVEVTPAADEGSSGLTPVAFHYSSGARVGLSVPAAAGGFRFRNWLMSGVEIPGGPAIEVTMDAARDLTAVYEEGPPIITRQPLSQDISPGGRAVFEVGAEGLGTLIYQWRFNGEEIPGANSAELVVDPVGEDDYGTYDVVVSNAAGAVNSDPATLGDAAAALANGGFEDGFESWSTSGNLGIQSALPYVPSEGLRLVAFNGGNRTPNGVVSQSLETVPGASYLLSFDMGVLAFNTNQQRIEARVVGSANLAAATFALNGAGGGAVRWVRHSVAFTADSTSSSISFRDVSTTTQNLDLLLDNVEVVRTVGRNLTIETEGPSDLLIGVSPADSLGRSGGASPLTRIYQDGTKVILTAPPTATGFVFANWRKNGVDLGSSATMEVLMDADHALTAVYAPGPPPADAAIANGSFENLLDGWSHGGNLGIREAPPYKATDGVRVVAFNIANRSPVGFVSQTFATVPGQAYVLEFDMGVLAYNKLEQRMQVELHSGNPLFNQVFALAGLGGGLVRWAARTVNFTATGSSTTVTFRDRSTTSNSIDLLLDHVRVRAAGASMAAAGLPHLEASLMDPGQTTTPNGLIGQAPEIRRVPDGFIVAMKDAGPGEYRLEKSRDLKRWTPAGEIVIELPGLVEFLDHNPAADRIFYRIGRSHASAGK